MTNRRLLLVWIAGALVLGLGCARTAPETEWVERVLPDGSKERLEQRVNSITRHGRYLRYYPDGTLAEQSTYKDGVLHGDRRLFYPNGTLEVEEHHEDGLYHGFYRHYYEHGVLEQELEYNGHAITGTARSWYPNGVLREEVTFLNNEENGPFKEYYENGVLKTEGFYRPGDPYPLEEGALREYGVDGALIRIAQCSQGRCTTTWKK